jgi:two-component system, LytTR family, response regulator
MKTGIKTLIIDDEVRSRSILRTMVSRHCSNITISGEASTIDEALKLIQDIQPEIIFLDIEMGLGTGFDLLGQLPEINFQTIFVTAYDSFAIKAIKWSALDYLLKPVDPAELVASVNKAIRAINNKDDKSSNEHTIVKGNKIGLPCMEGLKFVDIAHIVRCEAKGAYTEFSFTDQKKLLVSKPLQVYEEILESYNFFRVHHSHLINLNCIKQYNKGRGGSIVMADGEVITVAARKKDDFLKRILH